MNKKILNRVNAEQAKVLGITAIEWIAIVGLTATIAFAGGRALEQRKTKELLYSTPHVNDIHTTIDTSYWNVCYHDFSERPMGCVPIPPELRHVVR